MPTEMSKTEKPTEPSRYFPCLSRGLRPLLLCTNLAATRVLMRVDKIPTTHHSKTPNRKPNQVKTSSCKQLQVEEKAGGLVWSGLVCGVHLAQNKSKQKQKRQLWVWVCGQGHARGSRLSACGPARTGRGMRASRRAKAASEFTHKHQNDSKNTQRETGAKLGGRAGSWIEGFLY